MGGIFKLISLTVSTAICVLLNNTCYSKTLERHTNRKLRIMIRRNIYTLIVSNDSKPSSQVYYDKLFQICVLSRLITKQLWFPNFQHKLLNNALHLHKMVFRFRKNNSSLCSFCKIEDETLLHLFYDCTNQNIHGANWRNM